MMNEWFKVCCRRSVVLRSAKVALVVGTLLVLINHGGSIFRGEFNAGILVRMGLTYLVPYGVATYAAVESLRADDRGL